MIKSVLNTVKNRPIELPNLTIVSMYNAIFWNMRFPLKSTLEGYVYEKLVLKSAQWKVKKK